jgi:S-DNA-T family DNA segregation ATPase FtsK/SpoIIIE
MFEERSLRLDLFALAVFALVVFLALSFVTYDPADPVGELLYPLSLWYQPDVLVYPQATEIGNACGRLGAIAADMAFTLIGVGAFYLAFSLAVLDVLLLMRRPINTAGLRAFGWLMSLVGVTALLGTVTPGWSPGPVIGSGGYLGALAGAALFDYFSYYGGIILCVTLIVGGLLLCTDYALVRLSTTKRKSAARPRSSRRRLPTSASTSGRRDRDRDR